MKRNKKTIGIYIKPVVLILFLGMLFFVILHNGIIWFNMPSHKTYPVRGIDVSAHQGRIDWEVMAAQGFHFAFIKATEGSGFVDKKFAYNFKEAQEANLHIGAYHFFSFESSGEKQAKNFIQNVPKQSQHKESCLLPPIIDLEFYGNKASNPPESALIYKELDSMLAILTRHYGTKPIIYTTPSFYKAYLQGKYGEYPLWIRSVFFAPHSFFARMFDVYFPKDSWTFWQYNPKGIMQGYTDGERFIDLNVFHGSYADFIEKFCL